MFSSFNLNQLKQILKDFREHHNIRNYHKKLKKSDLLNEIEKHFQIDGGYLYALQGGSKDSGYVQKLESENIKHGKKTIVLSKMKNPSKYMIKKYGEHHTEPEYHHEPEFHHEPAPHDAHIEQFSIFAEHEVLDFDVGKKPKKKTNSKEAITDQQADKITKEKEQKLLEEQRKKKLKLTYKKLEKDLIEYNSKSIELKNKYSSDLEKLKKLRQTKQNKLLYENRIKQDTENKQRLKSQYKYLFEYMKEHKLNPCNLSLVQQHIHYEISRL